MAPFTALPQSKRRKKFRRRECGDIGCKECAVNCILWK